MSKGVIPRLLTPCCSGGKAFNEYACNETVDGLLVDHERATVVAQLCARVPDLTLLHEAEGLRPFECEELSA
jgi:hypothetical protein